MPTPQLMYPRWVLVIACTCILWSVLLWGRIATLSLPIFDDYCRGSANPSTELVPDTPHTGYLRAPLWSYQNWSGRWLAVIVEILLMNPVDMVRFYPALLVALLAAYALLIGLFFRVILGAVGWQVAAALALLYSSSATSPGEVLFSITFSVENLGVCTLAMAAWALAELPTPRSTLLKATHNAAMLVFAASVSAIHELSGVALCLALSFRFVAAWRNQEDSRIRWLAMLVIAGISLAVTVVAPGNQVRSNAMFAADRTLGGTLASLAMQSSSSLKLWVFGDLRLWAATVWLGCVVALARPSALSRARQRGVLFSAMLVILAISFALPVFAMGGQMPGRTLDQVYFIFLLAWFILVVHEAPEIARQWRLDQSVLRSVAAAALLVFCGSVAFDGNARLALRDLRLNAAQEWHAQHMDRIHRLRAAAMTHQDKVSLPEITANPSLLPHPRDSRDPAYANNLCMEWYFGVAEISVEPIH